MEWFRLAAQQGHPRSSYNLAIGHLSGLKTNLEVEYLYINMEGNNLKINLRSHRVLNHNIKS